MHLPIDHPLIHLDLKAGLIEQAPTAAFLEEVSKMVLQKSMENVYACGGKHLFFIKLFIFVWAYDGVRGKGAMDHIHIF